MRRDTLFRIASLTKPITAAAAMILVEECTRRLDEPVDRLLPELADRPVLQRLDGPRDDTVSTHRPITVRDLLTLRMGLGAIMAPSSPSPIQQALNEPQRLPGPPKPQRLPAPDAWLRRVATLPLRHQPSELWMYDLGLDVLGVLIARTAGQPLETCWRERLFAPLGMQDTGFSVPAAKRERLATCYQANSDTGALARYDATDDTSPWRRPPAFPSAAGGLVSTVDDALAFGQMLLHQGQHRRERILSRPAGRALDDRPADARAAGGGPRLPRRPPPLGVRLVRSHPARRRVGGARTVRLGRRPRHVLRRLRRRVASGD